MGKRITIKDVANYSGFSTSTVSIVLNNKGSRIPVEARDRIISAAKELNYIPNINARSLVSGRSRTIGVVIPDISNSFFSTLVHDIQIELNSKGYDVFLCNSDEKLSNDLKYIELLKCRDVDGMILALGAESMKSENLEKIKNLLDNLSIPIVLLDRYFEYNTNKVTIDNYSSGKNVIKVLYENNHRKIGLITGPLSLSSSRDRLDGVISFLTEKGLKLDNNLIYEGKYNYDSGYEGARKLINNGATAIFAFNDLQAYGVISYCNEMNINIPKELSVIGFDDLETSRIINPKLSTVRQPLDEMSLEVCKAIIDALDGKDEIKDVKLKTQIILRDSVSKYE